MSKEQKHQAIREALALLGYVVRATSGYQLAIVSQTVKQTAA